MKKIFVYILFVCSAIAQKQVNEGYTLEYIGQPVKSLPYLNFTLAEPEKGLESDILFNSFNPKGVYFIRYNHVTDKVTLHHLKNSVGLWGITNYDKERVFMGGVTKSQLYEYNIKKDKVSEVFASDNLKGYGYVFGEDYVWSLATSPEGIIYGVTYPNCKLFSFNPKTRITEEFGNMVEGEKYARYVCADFPGRLFIGVGTHARLIDYDIKTGYKRQILPKKYQEQSFVYHLNRFGNYLVALLSPDPILLVFDIEKREVIKEYDLSVYDQGLYLQKTIVYNDKLYFGLSPKDNLYSLDKGLNLKLEYKNAGGPIGLAAGRYLYCVSMLKRFTIIDLMEGKAVKTFVKNIEGKNGGSIFSFTLGDDGNFYGSGFINQHMFVFYPDKRTFKDFGVSINVPGQINSMIGLKGKIYSGHYVTAEVSEFDPKKEWAPGIEKTSNPSIIAGIKNEQDKIIDMDTDGKYIYLASLATYGKLGGCLSILDPEQRYMEVHRNIVYNQGLRSIRVIDDSLVAVGSFVHTSNEKAAKIAIWNKKNSEIYDMVQPLEKSYWIASIIKGNKDNLFSCVDSTLFIYNYLNKKIEFSKDLGWGNIYKLLYAADGFVYGVAKRAVFRFNLKDFSFLKLFTIDAESFTNYILQDKKGRIFLAVNENIYELRKN